MSDRVTSSQAWAELQQAGLLPRTVSRRWFSQVAVLGAGLFLTPGLLAEELAKTPALTEGPFYPDKLPLDTDNDLIVINDAVTPSVGEITHLAGRVLSSAGEPLRNAFVEIWQVDNNGSYIHSKSSNRQKYDNNFQGYGRFLTDSTGRYYFRTIKPVPYPGRCPHIHMAVSRNGQRILTTQLLIKGHPQNETDGVVRAVRDKKQLDLIMADFSPLADSKIGELAAQFDLVVGLTPNENSDGQIHGGIGKSDLSRARRS